MLKTFCRFVFFKVLGWRVKGTLPQLNKYVIAVAPHTSNWDFLIGITLRKMMSLEWMRFLGKEQLFRPPIGWWFRWMGGYPLIRSQSVNQVQQVVNYFNQNEHFIVVIAPEGTRKKVSHLKTGFYHIAKNASVPIVLVSFDYPSKTVVFREPFYPTDHSEQDLTFMEEYFKKFRGRIQ
ncbi:MAG: 1-acyl-sn-glycerol-3-phosphate acyltransferase [Chitinophagales bacterium]